MRIFLALLALSLSFALPACSGPAPADQEAVICCGGNCAAPAGTCCADGTCHGNHAELPIWDGK